MREAIRYCESKGYLLVYVAGPVQSAFFIHARDAYGIMLEVAGGGIRDDPRAEPGWAARWRAHPLGIERLNAVSYAVRDLEGAVGFLQSLTEAPVIYRGVDQDSGTESACLWIRDHVLSLIHI